MKNFLCKLGLLMCVSVTGLAIESPLGLPYVKDIKEIVKRGELRVVIYTDSALSPFVIVSDKLLSGYNVDMAQAIATQLGVKLHVDQVSSYNDAVASVAKDNDDIAISNVTATPGRALSVSFTEPYYATPQILITQKKFDVSKLKLDDEVVSMDPLRIGVEADSAYVYFVKLAFPQATVVPYTSLDQGISELSNNKYDAIFVDAFSGDAAIASKASLSLIRLGKVHTDPVSIVVSSEAPQLLSWLNLYLSSLEGKVTQSVLKKKVNLP